MACVGNMEIKESDCSCKNGTIILLSHLILDIRRWGNNANPRLIYFFDDKCA